MALINTTTTGILGSTFAADGTGALNVQQNGVTLGVYGNIPAFSAYKSANQTGITNSTFTKVTFNLEEFDTNNNYDTSTSRFTPTVAGYYQFNWTAGTPGANAEKMARIYKNGSSVKGGSDLIGYISSGSAILYMNGTTDYAEIYLVQITGSNANSYTGIDYGFSGALIRTA